MPFAEQGDEIDFRIHQGVEREILLSVACGDAPDTVLGMRVIRDGFKLCRLAGNFAHDGVKGRLSPDRGIPC